MSAEPKQVTTMKQAYRLSSGHRPTRLSVLVGVGGLVAMAMLTVLVGHSTPDTRSFTTVVAAPGQTKAPTTLSVPSAVPTIKAPPFNGAGWPGSNWFEIHKGQ
jgi:hypothetical protein